MSDVPQGPGWWRASNGLYYPPEARPGARSEGPGGQDGDRPPGDVEDPDHPVGHSDGTEGEPDEPAAPADEPDLPAATATATGSVDDPEPASWREAPLDDEPAPRKRRRWGRALLVVLLLAAVAAAAGVGVWLLLDDDSDAAAPTTTTDTTATPTTEGTTTTTEDTGEIPALDLAVGDCFDTAEVDANDGFVVTTVFLVDCDDEHRAEVFDIGTLDAPTGEAFPGVEARDQAARELCEPAFEQFVGVSLAESDLVLIWLAPTEESWDGDDREVACAVGAPADETLDEPVEGDEEPEDGDEEPSEAAQ